MWLGRLLDWQGQERMALYMAAALSLVATLLHLSVIPAHLGEWWGYGEFFLVLALSQGFYGLVLLCWHRCPVVLIGIAGNYAVFILYFITRAVGVPLLGPDAGEVEEIGAKDLASKWVEMTLILVLAFLLCVRYRPASRILEAG